MEQEKLFEKVKTLSRANNLFKQNDKIIVGLSGGPDSVFLLHFLLHIKNEYNLELIAAHLDHQWRDNSNIDAKFCADLCANLNVTFISEKAENLTPSKKFNGSKEEFARNLRRSFFENLLKKFEANSIALAHQKDDQIETFFLRLYRGTSLAGLTGIKIKNENYIRPLLNTNKSEILDMLHANNIKYVIDPTNSCDERSYFVICKHLVKSCFLNVQYFTTQRQNCLRMSISCTFGRTTCRITLNYE